MKAEAKPAGWGFDPGTYRPRPIAGVYVCDRGPAAEPLRFILIPRDLDAAVPLTIGERQIWELFDGKRTVTEVCSDYLLRHRALAPNRVHSLINRLWQARLLRDDPQLAPAPRRGWWSGWQMTGRWPVPVPMTEGLQRLLAPVARALRLHRPVVIAVIAVIALAGIYLASTSQVLPQYPLLRVRTIYLGGGADAISNTMALRDSAVLRSLPNYSAGLVLLLLLHLAFAFVRELWRGTVETRYTDRTEPVQFVFSYGLPTFSRLAKWRPGLPPGPRLACGLAGIQCELVLATVAMCLLHFVHWPASMQEILSKAVWILYARTFLHMGPMVNSDFTRLMHDMAGLPNYRQRALGFLRYGFFNAILGDAEMSREQRSFVTWNIVGIVWLVLAVRFALELLIRNQEVFTDLAFAFEQYSGLAFMIVVLLILPIVAAVLLALGGGLYLAWRWAVDEGLTRDILAIGASTTVVVAVAVAAMRLAGEYWQPTVPLLAGVLYVLSLVVFGSAMLTLMRNMHYRTGSAIGLKCLLLAVGLVASIFIVILQRLPQSPPLATRTSAAVAAVFFLAYHVLTPWRRQHLVNYVHTPLFLPELKIAVGTVLLLALGVLLAVRPTTPLDPGILAMVSFPAFTFIAVGVLCYFIQLNRVEVQVPPMILERPQHDMEIITSAFNFISRGLEQIIDGKFGPQAIERLERRLGADNDDGFSFGDMFLPDSADPEVFGKRCGAILSRVRQALIDSCGERFADRAFETTFVVLRWQARHALHRYVFPGTAWADRFARDLGVDHHDRRDVIDSTTMFADLPEDEKELLVRHLELEFAEPGEAIVNQGELGDTFYLLIGGRVQVEETDISGQRRLVSILDPGDFFGEASLLGDVRRMATVRAINEVRLLALHNRVFAAFERNHAAMVEHIVDHLRTLHTLFGSQLFGELPPNLLRSILPRVHSAVFQPHETIIHKGDIGREFYLIRSGHVEVVAEEGDTEERICELGPNDYFGEIALLRDIPRTATVRSLETTETLVLHKEDFLQLTASSAFFAANLNAVGTSRLQRDRSPARR